MVTTVAPVGRSKALAGGDVVKLVSSKLEPLLDEFDPPVDSTLASTPLSVTQ